MSLKINLTTEIHTTHQSQEQIDESKSYGSSGLGINANDKTIYQPT